MRHVKRGCSASGIQLARLWKLIVGRTEIMRRKPHLANETSRSDALVEPMHVITTSRQQQGIAAVGQQDTLLTKT